MSNSCTAVLSALLFAGAATYASQQYSADVASARAAASDVLDTNACELAVSPDKYDHKIVRLEAYISREFEDSTLHDPTCPAEALVNERRASSHEPRIWAEFADHIDYWHVTGFEPLVHDERVEQLQSLLSQRFSLHQMTSATMIGTFYAGRPIVMNGHSTTLRGFGHMGCCSLFVISQVESIQENDSGLNYSQYDWDIPVPRGCYSSQMLSLPTNDTIRGWQRIANEGGDDWRFDPLEVAQAQLTELKSRDSLGQSGGKVEQLAPSKSKIEAVPDARPTETLLEVSLTPKLKRYEYIEPNRAVRFVIVVARPYWLVTLAVSPKSIIWVPVGSSLLSCVVPRAQDAKQ